MSIRRKSIQKLTDSPKWTKIRDVFQSTKGIDQSSVPNAIQKDRKDCEEICNKSKDDECSTSALEIEQNLRIENNREFIKSSFSGTLQENSKISYKYLNKTGISEVKSNIPTTRNHEYEINEKCKSIDYFLNNIDNCSSPEVKQKKYSIVTKKYSHSQNVTKKRNLENIHRSNSNRQHKKKYFPLSRVSFCERKRNLCKFTSVKTLVNKYEQMEQESVKTHLDTNSKQFLNKQADRLSILNCQKMYRNRDDSGISEGEESLTSPLHINQFKGSDNGGQNIETLARKVYSNLNFGSNKEIRRIKSPKPRFIALKKPIPLPRTPIRNYLSLSECYSGNILIKEEIIKANENSKPSQSEEEWADISEEEKDGISENICNKIGKRCYQETGNLYDCCSPRRIQRLWKSYSSHDDNGTDSSWETCGDEDNSSTTSTEHHYEDLNDFNMEESQYTNESQSPNDFIEESFHFLGNHSADESDNADSPTISTSHVEKKSVESSFLGSRHSITESALIYKDINALSSSYKKTLKSITKANTMEVNKKKQSINEKSRNINFHHHYCQKPKSCECILEQLDEQKCKKKKKNYFTLPYHKNENKTSHMISETDDSFNHRRRASDCGPLTEQFSKFVSEMQSCKTGSDVCVSTMNLTERTRASVVSCNSCGEDYICRNHLEIMQSSLSSSEESIKQFEKHTESNVNDHNYLQINISENKKSSYSETSGSSQEDIYCSTNEYNRNSELYCDLHNSTSEESSFLKPQLTVAELAYLVESGEKKLWSDLPEVQISGILEKMSAQNLKLQEALLSVALSEATFLRLLETSQEHFVRSTNSDDNGLGKILSWHEWNVLFSDISPVIDVSKRLVANLESRWEERFLSFDIMDILYEHITNYFDAYIKYCSNKLYRDRMLKVLINTKPKFLEVTRNLECSFPIQNFTLQEFLTLPEQHISDLLTLIQEVHHWLPQNSTKYNLCKLTITALRKIISECIEGAQKMERMEEMLLLAHQLDFKECKAIPLISASRWLLKKGEMMQFSCDSPVKRTFGKSIRWSKFPIHIFLFNDLLVLTKRRSEDNYLVLDYCPKDMVQVKSGSQSTITLPTGCKNPIQFTLLSNQENKTVEMIMSCSSESDKIRWKDALTFTEKPKEQEQITPKRDYQLQCIRAYNAQQSDELCLNEGEIINVDTLT